MESGLGIEVQEIPGVAGACSVVLKGPLDARTVMSFKTEIHQLQQRGLRKFILDMNDVKYVNSTGLSFLITLSESMGEGLQAVTLVGVQPKVKIVFDTMSVSDFFKTAPSVAAAIQALKKEPKPKPKPAMAAAAAPARPKPAAPVVKREHSSTKTGRVSPPTDHKPPPGLFTRIWRRIFGRR